MMIIIIYKYIFKVQTYDIGFGYFFFSSEMTHFSYSCKYLQWNFHKPLILNITFTNLPVILKLVILDVRSHLFRIFLRCILVFLRCSQVFLVFLVFLRCSQAFLVFLVFLVLLVCLKCLQVFLVVHVFLAFIRCSRVFLVFLRCFRYFVYFNLFYVHSDF